MSQCTRTPDGIHGLVGGVNGSEVYCGYCLLLDEEQSKRAKDWWNGKHESDCLCSKCMLCNLAK